jgi:hypothetical protein
MFARNIRHTLKWETVFVNNVRLGLYPHWNCTTRVCVLPFKSSFVTCMHGLNVQQAAEADEGTWLYMRRTVQNSATFVCVILFVWFYPFRSLSNCVAARNAYLSSFVVWHFTRMRYHLFLLSQSLECIVTARPWGVLRCDQEAWCGRRHVPGEYGSVLCHLFLNFRCCTHTHTHTPTKYRKLNLMALGNSWADCIYLSDQ